MSPSMSLNLRYLVDFLFSHKRLSEIHIAEGSAMFVNEMAFESLEIGESCFREAALLIERAEFSEASACVFRFVSIVVYPVSLGVLVHHQHARIFHQSPVICFQVFCDHDLLEIGLRCEILSLCKEDSGNL